MRQGGPEEGHKAVAQHLVHSAFKAVHGVHHDVDGRVQELLGSFWIEVFDQLGRVFDVDKQHSDLFAFAFQGRTGGEDFFSEVWRRVGQRCPVLGCGGCYGWW